MFDVSFPSKTVASIDITPVHAFNVKFVYNFFVNDEMLNKAKPVNEIKKKTVDGYTQALDSQVYDRVNRFAPRYVKIGFKPVITTFGHEIERSNVDKKRERKKWFNIAENISKLHTQDDFSNNAFTDIVFQDTGLDGKLHLITSGAMARIINAQNTTTLSSIDNVIKNIGTATQLDQAKVLSNASDDSHGFIIDALNNINAMAAAYIDDTGAVIETQNKFNLLKDVQIHTQLNTKFLHNMIATVASDPIALYADELAQLINQARDRQNTAVKLANENKINSSEYDVKLDAVDVRIVDPSMTITPSGQSIGYIIERYEQLSDRSFKKLEPIIVQGHERTVIYDTDVVYGRTYAYAIRTVMQVTFPAIVDDSNHVAVITALIASREGSRRVVDCVEATPPPAPTNVRVRWDYGRQLLALTWDFPTNQQRDIKVFQVFRRASIHESFELLAEYDFDDSIVKTKRSESVDSILRHNVASPVMLYLDDEFSRDSSSIYAVCAIDAHGISSQYSMQIEARYDAFKNQLVSQMVSVAGAPKSYPNMLLKASPISDIIAASNVQRAHVYFNPDYASVVSTEGNNLKLLATHDIGLYRLQMMNVDLQLSHGVDIIINDVRKTKNQ